jgi:hypothetical protein
MEGDNVETGEIGMLFWTRSRCPSRLDPSICNSRRAHHVNAEVTSELTAVTGSRPEYAGRGIIDPGRWKRVLSAALSGG